MTDATTLRALGLVATIITRLLCVCDAGRR
nr:MAG TPA: hypothetical protein [Caudoviricetes sp.]